jgi:ankyrin repeat protein
MKKWFALGVLVFTALLVQLTAFAAQSENDLYYRKLARAAANSDNVSLKKLLPLAKKFRLSTSDYSALLVALIERSNVEGLTVAKRAGLDVNQSILSDREGEVVAILPLNLAVSLPTSKPFLVHLIRLGADVNRFAVDDHPPLLTALRLRNYDAVDVLLQHKANPNATDQVSGLTPLMILIGNEPDAIKFTALADKLISHRANVNAQTITGHTPLMLAVQSQNAKAVELLIKAGADVTRTSAHGETAASLAKKINNPDVLNWLVDASSNAPPK